MADGKQWAIVAAVALVCVGAAYGGGRLQTAGKVEEAEKRATAAESAGAAAASSVRVQLEVEKATVTRLEARRRLHQALIALDERNFGTAQEHLAAAKTLLARAKGSDTDLAKLSTDIDAIKLVATDDVGDQRTKILAIVKRLDELVPPAKL